MKKLVCFILVSVLLLAVTFSAVLYVQHSESGYSHTDWTVSVILKDDFKEKFGTDRVRRVSYDYDIEVSENRETAEVTLNMEVFIGDSSYIASAEGEIDAHRLPSGDVLWEGPIDGEILLGDKTVELTVGFAKVESSGDVSVSVAFSGMACGFTFGDYIMKGEVLEFFKDISS